MKLNNKTLREYIRKVIKASLLEAEKEAEKADAAEEKPAEEEGGEENPFAAAEEEGGDEAGGDKGGEEEKSAPKKAEAPAGIPVSFDISKVKQYNKVNFSSNNGIVKSIDKRGIVVTTQPDGVDVLVNFSDISENVKKFFKNKK